MSWRTVFMEWSGRWLPVALAVGAFAGAITIALLLPPRVAATGLGILSGAFLSYFAGKEPRRALGAAVFWIAATVIADAAYAKLNDQAPVTLANALAKLIDGAAKLADPVLSGIASGSNSPRAKIAALSPDFVWAVILTLFAGLLIRRIAKTEADA